MILRAAIVAGLVFAATPSVFAGFIATTGTDAVLTPAVGGPAVGDAFSTSATGGTLTSYIPLGPTDPQSLGDLSNYRYDLSGEVTEIGSTPASANLITYAGTYDVDYVNGSTVIPVSEGTFTILAQFGLGGAPNNASLNGSLIQTPGFVVPAPFADLSYGGNPVVYTGTYIGSDPGVSGTIQGSLIQAAGTPSGGSTAPEPASIGLLAIGATALVARRRAAK
jgi:hypothetical protein